VPPCAAWLRLLVTALLCVAGIARPVARPGDAASTVRVHEPMHVSAPGGKIELPRLGTRTSEDADDPNGIVETLYDGVASDPRLVEQPVARGARVASALYDLSRARGPPALAS